MGAQITKLASLDGAAVECLIVRARDTEFFAAAQALLAAGPGEAVCTRPATAKRSLTSAV
jgi:hypothetical protein